MLNISPQALDEATRLNEAKVIKCQERGCRAEATMVDANHRWSNARCEEHRFSARPCPGECGWPHAHPDAYMLGIPAGTTRGEVTRL